MILDKHGLPTYEECAYIKVPKATLETALDLLESEDIPHRSFLRAGEAFCHEEAEFRLRTYYREKEVDEAIIEQMAIDEKESFGGYLFSELLEGTLLDNDYIEMRTREHCEEEDED